MPEHTANGWTHPPRSSSRSSASSRSGSAVSMSGRNRIPPSALALMAALTTPSAHRAIGNRKRRHHSEASSSSSPSPLPSPDDPTSYPDAIQSLVQFSEELLDAQVLEYEARARELSEELTKWQAKRVKYKAKLVQVRRELHDLELETPTTGRSPCERCNDSQCDDGERSRTTASPLGNSVEPTDNADLVLPASFAQRERAIWATIAARQTRTAALHRQLFGLQAHGELDPQSPT